LPITAGLIWEAGNMLDMEVVKQFLQLGIGELTPIVALEDLGGILLEKQPEPLKQILCSHRQPSYQCFYLPPILSPFLGPRLGPIKAQAMCTSTVPLNPTNSHDFIFI